MTLVQVLADKKSVYMCCDFRLTNPLTGLVTMENAHKLVTVSRKTFRAMVGVTGLGAIEGLPVGEWIANVTRRLPFEATLGDLLEGLVDASPYLNSVKDRRLNRHSFILGIVEGMRTKVAMVSNFETIYGGRIKREQVSRDNLSISVHAVRRPVVFVVGAWDMVAERDVRRLYSALKSNLSDEEVHQRMGEVNVAVYKRFLRDGRVGTVSEGCFSWSLNVLGGGQGRPNLTDAQAGDFIPPEFRAMLQDAGLEFRRQVDSDGNPVPVRLLNITSVHHNPTPEYYRTLLREAPESPDAWNNYGAWLSNKGKKDEAIMAFKKAIELNPSFVVSLRNLAECSWLTGDLLAAASWYDRAFVACGSTIPTDLRSSYSAFLETKGDIAEAREQHDICVQDENSPVWRARRAIFLKFYGGYEEIGESDLEIALTRGSDNAEVRYTAGRIEVMEGNFESALAHFEAAVSLDQNNHRYLISYAQTLVLVGRPEASLYFYRKAIRRGASAAFYAGHYGYALYLVGSLSSAAKSLRRAIASYPDFHEHRINFAWVLAAFEQYADARVLLSEIDRSDLSSELKIEINALEMVLAFPSREHNVVSDISLLLRDGFRMDVSPLRAVCYRYRDRSASIFVGRLADMIEHKSTFDVEFLYS